MRPILYLLTAAVVMGLAFWAYQQNYRTKAAIEAVDQLQQDIARLREERGTLRAEWAYLNRPDRLAELVELNFDRLDLSPLRPDQFGRVDQVTFPPAKAVEDLPLDLDNAVEVSGPRDDETEESQP